MVRLEIIANNTVEMNIIERLEAINSEFAYSKIDSVHGKGNSDPKKGDAVWPEINFIIILYCAEDLAEKYISEINNLKTNFKGEGIKIFKVPCTEV